MSGDMVTVQWQGTGPSEQDQITQFTCIFDGAPEEPCKNTTLFSDMYKLYYSNNSSNLVYCSGIIEIVPQLLCNCMHNTITDSYGYVSADSITRFFSGRVHSQWSLRWRTQAHRETTTQPTLHTTHWATRQLYCRKLS